MIYIVLALVILNSVILVWHIIDEKIGRFPITIENWTIWVWTDKHNASGLDLKYLFKRRLK